MHSKIIESIQTTPLVAQKYHLEFAQEAQAQIVLDIIKDGFETWKKAGIDFAPSRQSLDQTIKHIQDFRGVLVKQDGGAPVATYSFEPLQVVNLLNDQVQIKVAHWARDYTKTALWNDSYENELAILFQKFSVMQSLQKTGLGRLLFNDFVGRSKQAGVIAIYVETSPQGPWLFEWYKSLGFEVIADSKPNLRGIATYLLRMQI